MNINYQVDLCFCIDLSASMNDFLIAWKLTFHGAIKDIRNNLKFKDKNVEVLRIKIIGFQNGEKKDEVLLEESAWFILPGNEDELELFLFNLKANGEELSSSPGLYAIEKAIKQKWTTRGDRQRHIIIVWSDTSTHPLEKNSGSKPSNYPVGMPKDFNELSVCWDGQEYMTNSSAKRLILFAPDNNAWTDIATHWENTIHHPSKAGDRLAELDYKTLIASVTNSI